MLLNKLKIESAIRSMK